MRDMDDDSLDPFVPGLRTLLHKVPFHRDHGTFARAFVKRTCQLYWLAISWRRSVLSWPSRHPRPSWDALGRHSRW